MGRVNAPASVLIGWFENKMIGTEMKDFDLASRLEGFFAKQ